MAIVTAFCETEYFILGQCLKYPEIIPFVAKAMGTDPDFRSTAYSWHNPLSGIIFSTIYGLLLDYGEIAVSMFFVAQMYADEPLLYEGENRKRNAIESARSLMNLQRKKTFG